MLWFVIAGMTLMTVGVLFFPFLRGRTKDAPARADFDIVVYRSQLAEIDQEIERGLLTNDQADAARAEIHRRMLAAEDAELLNPIKPTRTDGRHARVAAAVVLALVVPLCSIAMYELLGSPELPGKPYAWRLKHDPDFVVASTADALAVLLQTSPSASGYKRLCQMYFEARQFDKAADAARRAVQLGASDANTWSELGESVVMSNDGAVVPEALAAFGNALSLDPTNAPARFYVGLAEAQIGNLKRAVSIWRDLEKSADPNAAWLPLVRDHITAMAKEGGFDPASIAPSPPAAKSLHTENTAMEKAMHLATPNAAAPATLPGNAAPPVTEESRNTMVRAMVDRLANRMQTTPNDASGWVRLAHAYNVLGESAKARMAIDHAVRLKPADVNVQLTLAETEKALAAPGDDTPADFIASMRRVLKLDPKNVQALYYVGLAEMKAGHSDQARELWKSVLAVASPDDPLAVSARNQLGGISGNTKTD
jgi:cytochrome c-type biogenesis protein CcmH